MSPLIVALALPVSGYGQPFVTPLGGTPFEDWTIVNYVDLDNSSGVLDWRGGAVSYNGHDAIDFTLPNFVAMDAGIPVLAAADGTVFDVHDGEYDRWSYANPNTAGVPSNYVAIEHPNGVDTYYLHLARGSVSVAIGETVTAGEQIGLVGSSGHSTDPHLHFAVYDAGEVVETYLDPSYWWSDPLAYPNDDPGSLDSGLTDHVPSGAEWVDRPPSVERFYLDGGVQEVCSWARVYGFESGDLVRSIFRAPDGDPYADFSNSVANDFSFGNWAACFHLPDAAETGTWTVSTTVNGSPILEDAFDVLDVAYCNGLPASVDIGAGDLPTPGSDVILGTAGADIINGYGGDDTICGLGGDDTIYGAGGADRIFGGPGNDMLFGGGGDDVIDGEDGRDTLRGQGGADLLHDSGASASGPDTFYGNSGADEIHVGAAGGAAYGGGNDDVLHGSAQADELRGNAGLDTLYGYGGGDRLHGGNARDLIEGGDGDDLIFGEGSNDRLHGGGGNDVVVGGTGNDVLDGGPGDDDCQGQGGTNDIALGCESASGVP